MSCGTGIEECSIYSGQTRTDCQAGLGDSRPGAIPRGAGEWQSLVVKVSAQGSVEWQRVDSYKDPEWPPIGDPQWEAISSAAEMITVTSDGGLAVVMDDPAAGGLGVMKLDG
eukprot:2013990-Pyramimonas_sp.AAC.1